MATISELKGEKRNYFDSAKDENYQENQQKT